MRRFIYWSKKKNVNDNQCWWEPWNRWYSWKFWISFMEWKSNSHGSIEPNWPSYLLSNPIITSVLISSSPNWRSKYRLKKHNELDTIHWRCNLTKIVVRYYYFSEVTTPVRGGWQECEALWRRQFLQWGQAWLLWRWLVYHVTSAPTPLKGEGLSLHPPFF